MISIFLDFPDILFAAVIRQWIWYALGSSHE